MPFQIVYETLDAPVEVGGSYFISERDALRIHQEETRHYLMHFVRRNIYKSKLDQLEGRISESVVEGPYETAPRLEPAPRGEDDFSPPFAGIETFQKVIPVESYPESFMPIQVLRYGMRTPQELNDSAFRKVRFSAVQALRYLGRLEKEEYQDQTVFTLRSLNFSLLLHCYDGNRHDPLRSLHLTVLGYGAQDVHAPLRDLSLENGLRSLLGDSSIIARSLQKGFGYGNLQQVDLRNIDDPQIIL